MIAKTTATFVAFSVMIVGFLVYVAALGLRVSPPSARANLTLEVPDVNNLVVDSSVLLRGVPVGKVGRIDTTISNATIHFYIDSKFKVPADSLVRLENLSALGESYIELEPQKSEGPAFIDGQHVASDLIKAPRSISELGTSVVRMLNQLDPGQLENVIKEADAGLPDPYAVLPNLERASNLLRNTTAGLNGHGKMALENLQSLLENAGFVGSLLADAAPYVRELGPYVHDLWDYGASINLRLDSPGNVYIIGKFIQRIQKLLDDRAPDIRVLTEPLTPNIQAIANSLGTIDSGQVLTNLLAAVPEDGAINLHVTLPERQAGN